MGESHSVNKPHGKLLNTISMLYDVTERVVDKDLRKCGRTHTQTDHGEEQNAVHLQDLY